MFCICLILHILSPKCSEESLGAFFTLKFTSNTGTNFCNFLLIKLPLCNFSCKFLIIGFKKVLVLKISCKGLSLYLSQEILIFSCKVEYLEIDETCFSIAGFCIFQRASWGKRGYFSHFSAEKVTWCISAKIRLSFIFLGNSINKNRVVMVSKGCHDVIHFSVIGNFYISIYPVYY